MEWFPDPGGNDDTWCVLTKTLTLQGGGFAHIWLQTMSNPPSWPREGDGGFNWLVNKLNKIEIKRRFNEI